MITDVEGIVLKETRTAYNRRMITLLTGKYGKICAGTSIGERGKTRNSLAVRPFTLGRYSVHENRSGFSIDSAETVRSFYGIGENPDKYFNGAYVLEFTDKALEEGAAAGNVLRLLTDFFEIIEQREKGFGTLVIAYQVKLLQCLGIMPQLNSCSLCGSEENNVCFSVKDGGVICDSCKVIKDAETTVNRQDDSLIYRISFDIINTLKFFAENPLKRLENIALKEQTGRNIQTMIRSYARYHLDMPSMKSEKMI